MRTYMSSHIHLIISSQENELQDIIRDLKKNTPLRNLLKR